MTGHKGTPITINGYYIVGYVTGDEFRKRVHGRRHFLHNPPAIAFSIETLEEAQTRGAVLAHVYDIDTDTDYFAAIADILSVGFRFDRGYGAQVGLHIKDWRRKRPNEEVLDELAERSIDINGQQK